MAIYTISPDLTTDVAAVTGYFDQNTTTTVDEEAEAYWPLRFRILMSIVLCVLMIFAVFGNLLVVLVIGRHRGMQTRTNLFLCNLALADILCGVLDMPFTLITLIAGKWIFPNWLCQINGFTLPLLFIASIHTLMYISIHKFVSILYPFSRLLSKNKVVGMICASWAWAALSGYLTIYGLNRVSYKPYTTQCGPEYPYDFSTYLHMIFISVTGYFLPLFIMIICFVGIFWELKSHSSRMKRNTTMSKEAIYSQQRRIISTLLAVLVVFICSWVPYVIYGFYMSFGHDQDHDRVPPRANPFSYVCIYINSAFNPLIYAKGSPAFRDGYKEILFFWKPRRDDNNSDEDSVSYSAFDRFRTYMRDTLHATFHSSSDIYIHSTKSSISTLTHNVLFTKKRALSTCSLPQNFHYSVNIINKTDARYEAYHRRKSSRCACIDKLAQWCRTRHRGHAKSSDFPPAVQAELLQAPVNYCAQEYSLSYKTASKPNVTYRQRHNAEGNSEYGESPRRTPDGGGQSPTKASESGDSPNSLTNKLPDQSTTGITVPKQPPGIRVSFPETNQDMQKGSKEANPGLKTKGRRIHASASSSCRDVSKSTGSSEDAPPLVHSISEPTMLDIGVPPDDGVEPNTCLHEKQRNKAPHVSRGVLNVLRLRALQRLVKGSGNNSTPREANVPEIRIEDNRKRESPFAWLKRSKQCQTQEPHQDVKFNLGIPEATKVKAKSLPRMLAEKTKLYRRNTAKAKLYRCPSIEKLDRPTPRKRTYTDIPLTKFKRKAKRTSLRKNARVSKNANELELMDGDIHTVEEGTGGDMESPPVPVSRIRSGSDPCVTFKMLEDKVLSRRETKKWRKRERCKTLEQGQFVRPVLEHECRDEHIENSSQSIRLHSDALKIENDLLGSVSELQGNSENQPHNNERHYITLAPEPISEHDLAISDHATPDNKLSLRMAYHTKDTAVKFQLNLANDRNDAHDFNGSYKMIDGGDVDDRPLYNNNSSEPHTRSEFTGFYSSGQGSNRETVV